MFESSRRFKGAMVGVQHLFSMYFLVALSAAAVFVLSQARPQNEQLHLIGVKKDFHTHTRHRRTAGRPEPRYDPAEKTADYWNKKAQLTLNEQLSKKAITNPARNVIIFLGDGMSIPTLAAARAYLGQRHNQTGEEVQLSFEKLPYTGLSKTYCVDRQIADSACSATAYLCGVKANEGTIGVTATVQPLDCKAMLDEDQHVHSIARWSQLEGKRTGVVTTTRVTHASPAGVYAHTAHRDWESDADVKSTGDDPTLCRDIAYQLVHGETGRELNVILGGGRGKFLPNSTLDVNGHSGERLDGKNLIEEWLKKKKCEKTSKYVWDRQGLLNLPPGTENVLGLFNSDHCSYNLDRNGTVEPSLAEMVEAAIKILSQGENGYFLFVEGGRIDHAHHANQAQKALDETVEFATAVETGLQLTDRQDTLIVVTADHAHTMSYSGYPERGNDILGIAGMAQDNVSYATLSYANGPGFLPVDGNGMRHDVSKDNMSEKDYRFPVTAPLEQETHGGDDVGIFAVGPWAHLFTGVIEQNVIPHIMAYSCCVGNGVTTCDEELRKRKRKA